MQSFKSLRHRCARNHRFESLESRLVLSSAPVVADIEFGSSEWDSAFVDYLQTENLGDFGYSVPLVGSQQAALPWENLDRIYVTFNEDVDVDIADLALTGINTTQYEFADFFYDPQLLTARWTLQNSLDTDMVMIDLDADGDDAIRDLDGNRLEGSSTTGSPGSGSIPPSDFELNVPIVPGDADQNDAVSFIDYINVYFSQGQSTTSSTFDPLYDIDGSGLIGSDDSAEVFARVPNQLPSGQPAGELNDAPTTSATSALSIEDPAIDVAFSLWGNFDDIEDADTALSYAVLNNSNAALFDSVSINSSTGELVLNTAPGASGVAELTLEATDTGGLTVSHQLFVDVDNANIGPQILQFLAVAEAGDTWRISVQVFDADEDVTGWIVEFGGVFDARAVVYADGWAEFTVELPNGIQGNESASVTDSFGVTFTADTWVGTS